MTLTVDEVTEARSKILELINENRKQRIELENKLARCEDYLWQHSAHTMDTVVQAYVAMRDRRSELKADYTAHDNAAKDLMEKQDTWLLEKITETDVQSMRTEHGTAFLKTKTRYNVNDWPNYWAWLAQNERFDCLEKRPAQATLAKMEEEGAELPPGLSRYTERVVEVRRA